MSGTYGTTLRNTDDVRGRAYREVMDILTSLDWLDRAAVCETLLENGEFCLDCGKASPDGNICDCDSYREEKAGEK